MQYPFSMGLIQSSRDLCAMLADLLERQRPVAQAILQRLTLQEFHDDEIDAVLVAHIVDDADVCIVQRRDGPGFQLQALDGLGVRGQVLRQNLNGDVSSQAQVFGSIDLAHSTRAQSRLNFVTTEFCAYGKGHRFPATCDFSWLEGSLR